MKYNEWLKRNNSVDPINGQPILCPDCGAVIAHEKDYQFMVVTSPIVCPYCDEVVIEPTVSYTIQSTKIISAFGNSLSENQQDLDPEFSRTVDKYFWEMI